MPRRGGRLSYGGRIRGMSKTSRMQQQLAHYIKEVGRLYSVELYLRVVILVDGANWHRGRVVEEALKAIPHVRLYKLPPDSSLLQPIERLWRPLRHDVSYNVLYDTMPELPGALNGWLQEYKRKPLTYCTPLANCRSFPRPESV